MGAEPGHQLARGENVTFHRRNHRPAPGLGWVEVKLCIKRKDLPVIGMGRAAGRVKVRPVVAGIGGDVLKTGRRVLQPVERAGGILDMGVGRNPPLQVGDIGGGCCR
jgi:hypothetical protein